MGIYSYFRLEILDNQARKILKGDGKQHIIQTLFDDTEIDQYDFAENALTLDGETNDEAKWYDCQQDLEIFSTKHAHLTFIVGQRLCCPESEDEEGEFFMAITNGATRHIHEPAFMKAATLFNSREELQDAFMTMGHGDTVDLVFRGNDKQLELIYTKLHSTSFKEQTAKTFTLMSGGGGSSITVRIQPEQVEAFWNAAAQVLVIQ